MMWIKKLKGGAERFMGRVLSDVWEEFDEAKLDEKDLAYFKREAANYLDIAKTKPAQIIEREALAAAKKLIGDKVSPKGKK